MAGLLDILGQSPNNSLAPAGGYGGPQPFGSGAPSAAPTAPVPGASANPFSSALASDSPGILGILGRLAGNPTSKEMMLAKYGGMQAQGLAGLQKRIDSGMAPQQAVVDFISSPEGQQFFGSSQDPLGAIKGYLQLSQKPADEFITAGPGNAIVNKNTGAVSSVVPPTDVQNADSFVKLADLPPAQATEFYRAMLSKISQPGNPTQKEDATAWLRANGIIDPVMEHKINAGLIQVNQPRDAAGNPLGPPIAIDLSQMAQTGSPADVRMVPIGGNNGGPGGNQPAGTPQPDPATGQITRPSGDMIFASGPVGNFARIAGDLVGNIDPTISGRKYNDYRTQLASIFGAVNNISNADRGLAAEFKTYTDAVDQSGITKNPGAQGQVLVTLLDAVENQLAKDYAIMDSNSPRYTGATKDKVSNQIVQLETLRDKIPTKESLLASIERFNQGEGTIQQGIKEGASTVGHALEKAGEVGKAAQEAVTTTEKAVGADQGTSGGNQPQEFKTDQDAVAAANAGTLKPGADGKIHVRINGVDRTLSPTGGQ